MASSLEHQWLLLIVLPKSNYHSSLKELELKGSNSHSRSTPDMSAAHMTPSDIRRQSSPAMSAPDMSIPSSSCRCRSAAMSGRPRSIARYTHRCMAPPW